MWIKPKDNTFLVSQAAKKGYKVSDIAIGGMQKHQAVMRNSICPTLTASMGLGGGYVPMIVEYFSCAIRTRTYAGKPMTLEGGRAT